jgi:hypothetical protein
MFSRSCPHRCLSLGRSCLLEEGGNNFNSDGEDNNITNRPVFPFKLAAAQLVPPDRQNEDSSEGGASDVLRILWQAADASEGVQHTYEVGVGGLDDAAAAQLEDMLGDSDSDSDSCSDDET